MSTSIVLNDSTPTPAPTNGCCASVTDISGVSSPVKLSMKLSGAAGSATSNLVLQNSTNNTYLYYIGTSGDYDGTTIQGGTWTIPIKVSSLGSNPTVKSVFVCRANSSGTSLGTIGSTTGLSTALAVGVNTFTVTGSSVTFSTGDVAIISFQMAASGPGTTVLTHDQTITAPTSTVATPLVPQPQVISSSISEPGSFQKSAPLPFLKPAAGMVPQPHIKVSDFEQGGLFYRQRLPITPPAAMRPVQPFVLRSDDNQPGAFFRQPLLAPPKAGSVPQPHVFLWNEAFPGSFVKTPVLPVINPTRVAGGVPPPRFFEPPQPVFEGSFFAAKVLPLAPAARPGILILFYRGPKADLPILQKGEPAWCTDTNQMFVGDGYTNHFVGGMASSVPAHTGSSGYPGEYACDGTNYYICYALNSWARVGVSTAF